MLADISSAQSMEISELHASSSVQSYYTLRRRLIHVKRLARDMHSEQNNQHMGNVFSLVNNDDV